MNRELTLQAVVTEIVSFAVKNDGLPSCVAGAGLGLPHVWRDRAR